MTLPFRLPIPAGSVEAPNWDGQVFIIGDRRSPVLEYSENFAGWSDDLTALHEEAAGDKHPIDLASRHDAIAQVKKVIPSAKSVIMEIGCSSGFLLKDLVKSFPNAIIIGADVVKQPLYKLAQLLPGVPLIRFDLLRSPLPNQCVDVLIMLNVLEHIEDDVKALTNAYKLLKPGGSLIIEVPASPRLYDSYDAELHHFRRYSSQELHNKLTKAGFAVLRKSHLGFIVYPAFAVIKLMNRFRNRRDAKVVVHKQASQTSENRLIKWAMLFELKYLGRYSLPFGIRVLAVAKKGGLNE